MPRACVVRVVFLSTICQIRRFRPWPIYECVTRRWVNFHKNKRMSSLLRNNLLWRLFSMRVILVSVQERWLCSNFSVPHAKTTEKENLALTVLIYVAGDVIEIVHCQNSIPAIMQSAVDTTKKRPKLTTWRKKLSIFPLNFTWTFVLVELLMLLWWDLPGQL